MSKIRLDQTAAWFLGIIGAGVIFGAGAVLIQGTIGDKHAVKKATYLEKKYLDEHRAEGQEGTVEEKHSSKGSNHKGSSDDDMGVSHNSTHWSYEGESGPRFWGELSPSFTDCMDGRQQSPINIEHSTSDRELRPIKFSYRKVETFLKDNGHTLLAEMPGDYQGFISYHGKRYDLLNFHFHLPSEHLVAGVPYEMEMHLVHKSKNGDLAVVAVFLQEGKKGHRELGKIWHNLPQRKGLVGITAAVNPMKFLPKDRGYFAYMGSLTTPPCSEGVQWLILRKPSTLSGKQMEQFNYIFKHNARPVRPLHKRKIRKSSHR
jgi:carbonic anhydrase